MTRASVGQAYLYWGQFSANVAGLNRDMISIEEDSIVNGVVTEAQHHFHEGCSMRKRDGIYYLGRPTRGRSGRRSFRTGSPGRSTPAPSIAAMPVGMAP